MSDTGSSRCSRAGAPAVTRTRRSRSRRSSTRRGHTRAVRRRPARHRGPGRARGGLRDRPAARARAAAPAHARRTSPRSGARCAAFVPRARDRAPLPAACRRRLRRLRVVPVRARGAAAARARRRARAGRRARPREPHRRAARCARRRCRCPDTPLPRRDAHRQSGARRVRATSSASPRAIPALRRGLRRRAGRAHDQPGRARLLRRAGATAPISPCITSAGRATSTSARRSSPPRAAPATRCAYELVGYEEHMDLAATPGPRSRCAGRARARSPSSPRSGVPAVLVPLPGAPSDHQTRNAQTLERAGAAVMLRDGECDPARLDDVVSELLGAPDRLEQHGRAPRAASAAATRPSGSPISSRSTPVPRDDAASGDRAVARPVAAAPRAHRRRRRRGHERDRAACSRAWATRSAAPTSRARSCSSGSRPRASTCTSATAPSTCPPMPTRSCTRPRSRARTSSSSPRRERGIPVLHRSAALAALAATRAHDRGRRFARQDDDVVDARADPAQRGLVAELRDRRRGERGRQQRRVRRGGVAGRRGRRERRHVPAPRRPRPRSSRTSSPTTSTTTATSTRSSRAFEQFVDGGRRPGRVLRRRRRRRRASPATRPAIRTYGFDAERATTASSTRSSTRAVAGSRSIGDGEPHRRSRSRPAVKAATNAAGATAIALGARRRRSSRGRGALAGFGGVARRFQYRGERDGVTFIDDYAHLPTEVARRDRRRAPGAVAARGRRVPAAPLHAHRVDRAAVRRRVRPTPTRSCSPTCTPRARRRSRACRAAWSCAPCSTAIPALPVAYLPRPADLVAGPGAVRARGRPRADARRRRPHDACPTSGSGATVVTSRAPSSDGVAALEARARRVGSSGDAPSARAHDLPVRRARRRARARRARARPRRGRAGARRAPGRAGPRDRAGFEPARRRPRASPGSRSCSRGEFERIDVDPAAARVRRRRRGRAPGARPSGRRRPGSAGSSSSSASRAASAARCA